MVDVNKLLTAILASGADPRSSRDGRPPSDRYRPTDRGAGGRPAGAGSDPFSLQQMIGEAASGRGGFGEFLSRNAGLFGGGAVAGGLSGVLLSSKHARKFAGTALQVGAAAVLGGLAYKAFQDYRAGKPVIPQGLQDAVQGMLAPGAGAAAPADEPAVRRTDRTQEHTATLLLRAMIASAMADGRIDELERQRLIDRVEASELALEERALLETLIEKPDPPAELAASVASPEEAAQVYLAAFIAIDADSPAERAWLDELAEKLALDPPLRSNLEAAGEVALGQAT
jgi:uncharacterized membrane protein YebE (DUF533 family)